MKKNQSPVEWAVEKLSNFILIGHDFEIGLVLEQAKKMEDDNKREIRTAVANYISSEGCSCCEGDNHEKHQKKLAKLLDVPKYEDGSGYNFSLFKDK